MGSNQHFLIINCFSNYQWIELNLPWITMFDRPVDVRTSHSLSCFRTLCLFWLYPMLMSAWLKSKNPIVIDGWHEYLDDAPEIGWDRKKYWLSSILLYSFGTARSNAVNMVLYLIEQRWMAVVLYYKTWITQKFFVKEKEKC